MQQVIHTENDAVTITRIDAPNGEVLLVFEWPDGSHAWLESTKDQMKRWGKNRRAAERRYAREIEKRSAAQQAQQAAAIEREDLPF